jgi:hypothetical protein
LINQSLVDDSKIGDIVKPYVERKMLGKRSFLILYTYNVIYNLSLFDSQILRLFSNPCLPYNTVPDDLVLQLLQKQLSKLDAVTKGWVLHGFPKTREQAEALTRAGFEPNRYPIQLFLFNV